MVDIIKAGLTGVQAGLSQAAKDVDRISKAAASGADDELTSGLVDLKQDEQQVKASAKVIKVGDELLGTILDILG